MWLRVGGARERITVSHLASDTETQALFAKFRASSARCYKPRDRQHLLAVIESGFGSLAPFNSLIRGVFRDARATHLESLVVHLQREQTELKGMIESLLRHHGVPEVAPVEDELEA